MRIGIIDVGSQSVLMFVTSYSKEQWIEPLDFAEVTKLGEGFKDNLITYKAAEQTIGLICKYKQIAKELNVKKLFLLGTMVLREAKNKKMFIDNLKKTCKLNINILSPYEEANYSFLGIIKKKNALIIDLGGGSCEFIYGNQGSMKQFFSLKIGSLILFNMYKEEMKAIDRYVKNKLSSIKLPSFDNYIAIGGTITTLASIKLNLQTYKPQLIEGTVLTYSDIERILKSILPLTKEERLRIKGLESGREEIITAGAKIYLSIMDYFDIDKFTLSTRGLRHGVAYAFYNNLPCIRRLNVNNI